MQGLKGDATYLVVTDKGEIEKYGINGKACRQAAHRARSELLQHMMHCRDPFP